MEEPRESQPRREPLLVPARRLGDLRVERAGGEEVRVALGRAALEVAGEFGYRGLTVDRILARGGTSRVVFYRLFASAEDCYLAGYEAVANRFVEGLLDRCRAAPGWAAGVRAALDALAEAIASAPLLADGLILRVRSGDEVALAARQGSLARLATALDRGREVTPAGLTPPPSAADFVIASIEAAAGQALGRRDPEEFVERVPDLAFLAIATYLGVDVAREAD
jgi:AcrR family transcriptional regulator